MYRPIKSTILLALFLSLIPYGVQALQSDQSKIVNVEADKATIDKKSGTSTYLGNVIVQQGSMRITADKLTVYTKRGKLNRIRAQGNPAAFEQQGKDSKNISAIAATITYQANDNVILFENGAELRQGANKFASNRIIYDISKDTVNAGKKSGGDRVTITIQPADPGSP